MYIFGINISGQIILVCFGVIKEEVRASWSLWWVKSSQSEKNSQYNRKRASGAGHTQCVHHIWCSSEAASGNVVKYSKVRASWSSRSVKSSGYNRKRASGASHTQCV